MSEYTMPCPRCQDGRLTVKTSCEYHPEYPGGAWEPEHIEGIEPDCDCWNTGETCIIDGRVENVLSADLWDVDTSKAVMVEP